MSDQFDPTQPLDLGSTKPRSCVVIIDGVRYLLREASGGAAVKYRNMTISKAKMKNGEVVGIDGVADAEPFLVSLCISTEEGNHPVPVQVITSWPQRIQKELFDRVKQMSDLDRPSSPDAIRRQIADLQKQLAESEAEPDPK